jgi:hypothetical protein
VVECHLSNQPMHATIAPIIIANISVVANRRRTDFFMIFSSVGMPRSLIRADIVYLILSTVWLCSK